MLGELESNKRAGATWLAIRTATEDVTRAYSSWQSGGKANFVICEPLVLEETH
jgi:hypothetical protein